MKISRYNISCKLLNGEYVICMRFSKKGKYVKFSDIIEVKKPVKQQPKVTIPRSCKVCKFKIKCASHKRNDGFCIERHSGVL